MCSCFAGHLQRLTKISKRGGCPLISGESWEEFGWPSRSGQAHRLHRVPGDPRSLTPHCDPPAAAAPEAERGVGVGVGGWHTPAPRCISSAASARLKPWQPTPHPLNNNSWHLIALFLFILFSNWVQPRKLWLPVLECFDSGTVNCLISWANTILRNFSLYTMAALCERRGSPFRPW